LLPTRNLHAGTLGTVKITLANVGIQGTLGTLGKLVPIGTLGTGRAVGTGLEQY